mmetsp:Transcript_40468/g.61725  ORF Transcript_40468/g.61725 Transcript_40468/m.61725 type:complete len:269 (+) Transcript_40468:143-949(+)
MESGDRFDPRIRRECIMRLIQLMKKQGRVFSKLEELLDEFKHRDKDIVFLVNEEVRLSTQQEDRIENKIKRSLAFIFDNHVDSSLHGQDKQAAAELGKKAIGDRISLMQYGKNVKRMFSLVSLNKNKTQLRNQINRLKFKLKHFQPPEEFKQALFLGSGLNSISARNISTRTGATTGTLGGVSGRSPQKDNGSSTNGGGSNRFDPHGSSNIIKALRESINEFIKAGATLATDKQGAPSALAGDSASENKRLIVVFTSRFEIGKKTKEH